MVFNRKGLKFVFVLLLYAPIQQLCSMQDVNLITLYLGRPEQGVSQFLMHILSLVTGNNPSGMIQPNGGE